MDRIVQNDGIKMFFREFPAGIGRAIIRFEGEADEKLMGLPASELFEEIGICLEIERQTTFSLLSLDL